MPDESLPPSIRGSGETSRVVSPHSLAWTNLGPGSTSILSDMARELGEDRFHAFWTSDQPVEQAFATASGISLDAWMRHWLADTAAPPKSRAMPSLANDVWLAAALPLLTLAPARSRDGCCEGKKKTRLCAES
ncbi:MAG TPA: hypothetical protein VF178_07905 [Gemmatimonadaceae bacterium]